MTASDAGSPQGAPNTTILDSRIDYALDQRRGRSGSGDGGGQELPARMARLEGVFESFKSVVEGIRHAQNLMLTIFGVLSAVLIGVAIYQMQRLDQLSEQINETNQKVAEVPGKVSSDVQNLTATLATTITAARQPEPMRGAVPHATKRIPQKN
jgi:outer membrane murein-binding lipoprotein Lpp